MSAKHNELLTSPVIVLPIDNIDTDQIIPARFLKTTSRHGLGDYLFADWRYDEAGRERPEFALNAPGAEAARVLLAGDNFGCGSSREHAPWSLLDFGLRAIVSTSFADIFRNNALKNGLLPIEIDKETHQQLVSLLQEAPDSELSVDLSEQELKLPDGRRVHFPIDTFNKHCLLEGVDQLGYLLNHDAQITEFEQNHPSPVQISV